LDKIIIGAGLGLVSLGVGFLAASPMMFEVREPFILGGLLWSIIGGITIMIGRSKGSKKRRELGALR
jgi:hypothetical protein